MIPGPFVPLGRVVKTHGLKGEVSVKTDSALSLELPIDLEVWFVPPPVGLRSGRIQGVRPGPKGPLFKVSGVDDITTAASLVGTEILASAAEMPGDWNESLEPEDDAVGLEVTDVRRGLLGQVVEVIVTGANDVWVIQGPLGEVLLPVIDDVVLDIDWNDRVASVRALAGLLPDAENNA